MLGGIVSIEAASRSADHRQLFEQNLAVQLVVEPTDGRIVDANRAAADFYALPREELVRRRLPDFAVLPEDDTLQTLEVAAQVGAHSYAFPHRRATGEVRLVEIHAGPLTIDGRTLVHLIVHDVSERVRAEEEARELHAERVARHRTSALEDALRRRENLSRMGELVAGVAHEVRTPLFAISSTLDAMRARFGKVAELERYFPVLTSQVERLNALMRDLLDYGKPAALVVGDVEVTDLLAVVAELTRSTADELGVRLRADTPPGLRLRADRQRLLQVLQNIACNAAQHSPRGGEVVLQARAAVLPSGAAVQFTVLDEGAGFAPDDLAQLFRPFFSRRSGGTGLGLALAHRIVSEHGGTIAAANREGGGATITVCLPVHPAPGLGDSA